MVTVYSKNKCVQCKATIDALKRRNIEPTVISLEENEEALKLITSLGFKSAPVVEYQGRYWSGYRPDEIEKI